MVAEELDRVNTDKPIVSVEEKKGGKIKEKPKAKPKEEKKVEK